jgi:hypothetical protein
MNCSMERRLLAATKRRACCSRSTIGFDALEDRRLLSTGIGIAGGRLSGMIPASMRGAEMAMFRGGRQDGLFGGGSLGLGGAVRNPILLLTAPLLEGGSGTTTPPSPGLFSSSSVQQAIQTLQTDLNNAVPANTQPTHASVGQLQDDLGAIRQGKLSGSAAQTKIQADQAATLTSMGLTQAQISQIQSDQQAVLTAIQASTTTAATASGSTTTTTSGSTSASSANPAGTTSAVQTAMQTLQTDLQNDTPSGAMPTHAAIGAVQDDLDAIRKGTLTGSAAVTQVQADSAAVLSSMGLTTAQITQIQADQQAVATALATASSSSTTTAASTTESTLQSVAPYLIGIPGVGGIGMRGLGGLGAGGFGSGGGFGGFGSGGGWGHRGGFGGWR